MTTMHQPRLLGLAVLGAALVLLSARADEMASDPLPLRRVQLPAARLAAELKRLNDGILVRKPRADFEKLVREAARARTRKPPRLVEARYSARLSDAPALEGTAQWKVRNPGSAPGLLRLGGANGFNLAVKQPRYDSRDALLADFPDPEGGARERSLALLVDEPGEHTVTLEWSARVEPLPEGLQVALRLPPCPAASLELDLPAGRTVMPLDATILVSGPHPADDAARRRWRIACGGKTHLPLLLRRSEGKDDPVVLATQSSTQRLSPDGVEASHRFTLQVPQQDVQTLVVACDPAMRPVDVTCDPAMRLERWDVKAGAPGEPVEVEIRFARPVREGTVEVKALAPLAGAPEHRVNGSLHVNWASPGMTLLRAIPQGETLELRVHPQLRLLSWRPGDYRLTSSSEEAEGGVTWRRLTLHGGGVASTRGGRTAPPRRPGGLVQTGGVEFRVRQQNLWRPADSAELTAQIDYEVGQGQLFQLELLLPAGYEPESVDLSPPDLLRTYGVRSSPAGGSPAGRLLLVDLRRPLRVGSKEAGTTLNVRLRPANPGPEVNRHVPFPDLVPVGARIREGGMAIEFDERVYRGAVRTSLTPSEQVPAGPWGKDVPDYYYPFHGNNLGGTLRLLPRPARFTARAAADLYVTGGRAALDVRLRLEAESGTPTSVDVYRSGGDAAPWTWTSEPSGGRGFLAPRVLRADRLHHVEVAAGLATFAAQTPLQTLALQAARPPGTFWRLVLDRPLPLRQGVTLRAQPVLPATNPDDPGRPRWQVPLVTAVGAIRGEGEVTLHLARADQIAVENTGLREAPAPRRLAAGETLTPWRSFRYADGQCALSVQARNLAPDQVAEAIFDRVRLTTLLSLEGELRHHFSCRVVRWSLRTLPLSLPEGAEVVSVAVDGKWLERHGKVDENGTLALPVPATGPNNPSRLEVVYRTPSGPLWTWRGLSSPRPKLPGMPADFERRWLLPAGVVPAGDGGVQPLFGAAPSPTPSASDRLLGLFRLGPRLTFPGRAADPRGEHRQAFADASAGLRGDHGGKKMTLGAVVEELSLGYFRDLRHLVIDRTALSQAGVSAGTVLTVLPKLDTPGEDWQMPWEETSLVVVPAGAGLLLTTRSELSHWEQETFPEGVESALAEAVRMGRDPGGRYFDALEWLAPERSSPQAVQFLRCGADLDGWTAWTPVPGTPAEDTLTVVRRTHVAVAGLLLAGMTGLAFVLLRERPPLLRLVLLGCLALFGLATAWLPSALGDLGWWPALLCLSVGLAWYLRWASLQIRQPGAQSSLSGKVLLAGSSATAVAVLLTVAWSAGTVWGQKPEGDVVYVLPAEREEPESVLVAPDLISRLEALARAAAPASGAVLFSGSYEGRVVEGHAEFKATFGVHALDEGPVTLELPLAGVQLTGEVWLDGARVLPEALPAPQAGYSFRVKGAGRHRIELNFQVPVTPATEGGRKARVDGDLLRQVRFTVPSLVQSRLTFQGPSGARHLHVPTINHGGLRLGRETEGEKLTVELGGMVSAVTLRWYQESKPPRQAKVEFREAYVWDLQPGSSELTGFIRYEISRGVATSLSLEVPAELAVRSVEARRPRGPGEKGPQGRILLNDWTLTGAGAFRTLRLDFAAPVLGAAEVTLKLVPRAPWSGTVLLPLPRPLGEPRRAVPPAPSSYLAYRAQGLRVVRTNWLRLTGILPAEFAPFCPEGVKGRGTLEYASTFRRDPQQPPELHVQLQPLAPAVQVRQDVRLTVGAARAELQATAELSAAGDEKDLALIEWEVGSPASVLITGVTGPEVSRWTQSGSRLLIWLRQSARQAKIELAGWVLLSPAGVKGKKPPAALPARLELPALRPLASNVQTRLTLTPAPGLLLSPESLRQLKPEKQSSRELRYVARDSGAGSRFLVRQGPPPQVSVQTTVRIEGKELVFSSDVEYRLQGELRSVKIRLRDWDGEATLEAPEKTVARRGEQQRQSGGGRERGWHLELVPGVAGRYRVQVRGRMPLDDLAGTVHAPDVTAGGADARRTLVVAGSLLPESPSGLVPAPVPAGSPPDSQAYQIKNEDWSLCLVPRELTRPAAIRVLLAEGRSAAADGQRWLHEVRYALQHELPAELILAWPNEVEVVVVTIDGVPMPLLEPDNGRLWLPLSGPGGVRRVAVRYRHAGSQESLARPDLTPPQPVGPPAVPMLWTLDVPAGWGVVGDGGQALGGGDTFPGLTRRAAAELHRAAGELAVSRELCRHLPAQAKALAESQARLERSLWLARMALDSGADGGQRFGPLGKTAAVWMEELRQRNRKLIKEEFPEGTAPQADRRPGEPVPVPEELGGSGTPMSWRLPPGERPAVRLAPDVRRQWRQTLTFTAGWLLLVLFAWTVAQSRTLRMLARWLWPEQLVLVGALGWHLAGPTPVVLGLVAMGVTGRLLIAGLGLRTMIRAMSRTVTGRSSLGS